MPIPSYPLTTYIPGSACIGDSRNTINANFSALDVNLTSINTNLSTDSLSARFINLAHSPFNDGVNPNLFIGEVGDGTTGSITGSLTGFNTTYDETNNKLYVSTQQGSISANVITYTFNNNVGINTTAPNQTLTVNGSISATGIASVSALQINNNTVISSAVGGSQNKKFPVYDQNGSFIGYIPLYTA